MQKRKPLNRAQVLEKTSRKMNLGRRLTISGAATLGIAGVITFAELSKARNPAEAKMALCGMVGGILAGFAVGLAGKKISSDVLKKLIGKPRVCRKIANDIENPYQRMLVRVMGHIDWKNKSVNESFRKWYVDKNAGVMEQNIAKRAISKAMQKAKYDESLFEANRI